MTREIALHCMKSASEAEKELCEECPIYGQTGCDHCYEDALRYVIAMLKQEPRKGYLSIDNVMSVFDDFMCGEVDENGTETFLEMLKDKAESVEEEISNE